MPALSSTMTEGKIVSWLMSEGDAIGKGAVVVVESDKADMDVESFVDGIIAHIAVEDGEMATVGAPIAYVVDDESEIAEAKAKSGGRRRPARRRRAGAAEPAAPRRPRPRLRRPRRRRPHRRRPRPRRRRRLDASSRRRTRRSSRRSTRSISTAWRDGLERSHHRG